MMAGVLLHGGYLGGVWWAIAQGLPAGISALITAAQPLLTALLAAPLLGERVTTRQWVGIVAGFVGIVLVLAPRLAGGRCGRARRRRAADDRQFRRHRFR